MVVVVTYHCLGCFRWRRNEALGVPLRILSGGGGGDFCLVVTVWGLRDFGDQALTLTAYEFPEPPKPFR